MLIDELDKESRRKLLHLVCVAAWSDLSVSPEERLVVMQLCMELTQVEEELEEVRSWLDAPPPYFDPQQIPAEHRQAFFEALLAVVAADGRVTPEESETIRLIGELIE